MQTILIFSSLVGGGLVVWFFMSRRVRGLADQRDATQEQLTQERIQSATAKTQLEERVSSLTEKLKSNEDMEKVFREHMKSLSNEALNINRKAFLEEAENKFNDTTKQFESKFKDATKHVETLMNHSQKNLKTMVDSTEKNVKTMVDSSGKNLNENLKRLDEKVFDLDKNTKTLNENSRNWGLEAQKLNSMLSNIKVRGSLGEFIAEDILRILGLKENINYYKQKKLANGKTPDYILKLPPDSRLIMDVKFPIDNYKAYTYAESKQEQDALKNQLKLNVTTHINKVNESYVNAEDNKLEFVLMFIPNESVYRFIDENYENLIKKSFEKKVVVCSPAILYAILSLVRQSIKSFAIKKDIIEIKKVISKCQDEWRLFTNKMDEVNKSLESAHEDYRILMGARRRGLDKHMRKITDLDLGERNEELQAPSENGALLLKDEVEKL